MTFVNSVQSVLSVCPWLAEDGDVRLPVPTVPPGWTCVRPVVILQTAKTLQGRGSGCPSW